MKKLYLSESQISMLMEVQKNEVVFFEFFRDLKKFLKELLTNPLKAKVSGVLVDEFDLNEKELKSILFDKNIITKKESFSEDYDERKGKEISHYHVSYQIPKKNFKENILSLYNELNRKRLSEGREFLTEDKRSKQAKKKTLEVIKQVFNNADWLYQPAVADVQYDGNTIDYLEKSIKDNFFHSPLKDSSIIRIEPIIAKIAYGELGYEQNEPDNNRLNKLRQFTEYIYQNYDTNGNQFECDPNANYQWFESTIGDAIEELNNREREEAEQSVYEVNNDYEILSGVDYKTAHEYGNHSCSSSKLCYTQREGTWDNYTAQGENKVYILLKHGWESIPEVHGEGDPYDEYGLSMIFVFINQQGNLAFSNTRWNHHTNSNVSVDHSFDMKQLSQILGQNAYNVLKPWTNEELRSMGIIPFEEKVATALGLAQQGDFSGFDDCNDRGNGIFAISVDGKWNFINTKCELLSPNLWFSHVGNFNDGYARVQRGEDGNWNLFNLEGQFLNPNLWFDYIGNFYNGYALVRRDEDHRWNFINTKCELVSPNLWFSCVDNFNDGYARVRNEDYKWNFVNTEGQLLSPDLWFDAASDFRDGYAKVRNEDDKYNFINTEGQLLSPSLWFNRAYSFQNGYASVQRDEDYKWNFVNTERQLVSPNLWFDAVGDFNDGYARVRNEDDKYNFINTEGQLLSPSLWFDAASDFNDGYAGVRNEDDKCNFINTEGQLLSPDLWFDAASDFRDGYAKVRNEDDKYNFINTEGQLLSPSLWFNRAYSFQNGYASVQRDEDYKWNFVNTERQLVSPNLWFDAVGDFNDGYARVRNEDDKYNFINTEGQLLSPSLWFDAASDFNDGYAGVRNEDDKCNFINTEGQLLSPNLWFDNVDNFENGYAKVCIWDDDEEKFRYNLIDKNGNFVISGKWPTRIRSYDERMVYYVVDGVRLIKTLEDGKVYNVTPPKEVSNVVEAITRKVINLLKESSNGTIGLENGGEYYHMDDEFGNLNEIGNTPQGRKKIGQIIANHNKGYVFGDKDDKRTDKVMNVLDYANNDFNMNSDANQELKNRRYKDFLKGYKEVNGVSKESHEDNEVSEQEVESNGIKVLCACEESQAVCKAFRAMGFDAVSCDIQPASGGHDEWHIMGDALEALNSQDWDVVIAFPPCTDLAASNNRHLKDKQEDGRTQKAYEFFMKFVNCGAPFVAIENPVGVMSNMYRKPDQIINPSEFGDPWDKRTCLWLKNLPRLIPSKEVEAEKGGWVQNHHGSYMRSKTFPGIAGAMAQQWGAYILSKLKR